MNWSIVFGAVLGAVLALGTSLIMELVRGRLAERRARRLFLAVLRVEVPGILATLESLVSDFEKMGYFPLITVNQLQAQRAGYDRHQTSVIFLTDAGVRDEIINFYQRLAVLAQEVTAHEQLLLARPDTKDLVQRKRAEFVGRLRDLGTRGRALVPRLAG
jgi:hypothetical protein